MGTWFFVTPLVALIAAVVGHVSAKQTINIVALVDTSEPHHATDLEEAVEYATAASAGLLSANLTTIFTLNNDNVLVIDRLCGLLSDRQADILLDLSSASPGLAAGTVQSLVQSVGLPHVIVTSDSTIQLPPAPHYVQVLSPAAVMLGALRDVVELENITSLAIIYDHTFVEAVQPRRFLQNLNVQHVYQPAVAAVTGDAAAWEDVARQLDDLKRLDLTSVFLLVQADTAAAYLEMAEQRGMTTYKYNWYIMTKDPAVSCPWCRLVSAVGITARPAPAAASSQYRVALRANNASLEVGSAFHYDVVTMMLEAVHGSSSGQSTPWQPPTTDSAECPPPVVSDAVNEQTERFYTYLQQGAHGDSGVFGPYLWHAGVARQQLALDISRIVFSSDGSAKREQVATWSEETGLNTTAESLSRANRKQHYRVITIQDEPFIFKSKTPPPPEKKVKYVYHNRISGDYYFGYCIDLIFHINSTLNFEFDIVEPEDGAYGTMQEDGSWNGMVRDLMEDRADIIVAPLSVMAERENVIDFTVPYYDLVGITILMKKPPFNSSLFKFMDVLENPVWGCVLAAFIVVSVLLSAFDKYSPYSYQNNRHTWTGKGDEPRIFSLKEGLWFCMTSLTPQGGGEAPRALSGRLVAATWWVFGFIMIATYTANLAAFLTVSRLDQPIESLDDLAKQFKYRYAPQASTSTQTYFKRMADIEEKFYTIWKDMSLNDTMDEIERAKLAVWDYPVSDKFTNMWTSMQEAGFPETFKGAVARMKNPPPGQEFAFIGDATVNKHAVYTDCDLWEVGEEFSRKPYALAVQEGSTLKNELSSRILQLLNQRVLEDLKTTWWDYDRVTCDATRDDDSDGISINSIGGVFLVIFIGIGLGLITLAFEYYWYKWRPAAKDTGTTDPAGEKKMANGSNGSNGSSSGGIHSSVVPESKYRPPVGHHANEYSRPPAPGGEEEYQVSSSRPPAGYDDFAANSKRAPAGYENDARFLPLYADPSSKDNKAFIFN